MPMGLLAPIDHTLESLQGIKRHDCDIKAIHALPKFIKDRLVGAPHVHIDAAIRR